MIWGGGVNPSGFQGSYEVMTQVIQALEYNGYYKTTVLGEPQLGKRGLYPNISQKGSYDEVTAMVDLIAYADGKNDLIDISNRIGVPISRLHELAVKLKNGGLMSEVE